MTDPRRQRFAPYLRDLADRLGLKDWRVVIHDDDPSDPGAYASAHIPPGRKILNVRIGSSLLDETPEEIRHCLVHELMHAHFDAAWNIGCEAMPDEAAPAFRRMMEHGIDGVSEATAPLMPLPPTEGGD